MLSSRVNQIALTAKCLQGKSSLACQKQRAIICRAPGLVGLDRLRC